MLRTKEGISNTAVPMQNDAQGGMLSQILQVKIDKLTNNILKFHIVVTSLKYEFHLCQVIF